MKIVMTKKEYEETMDLLIMDPCESIECNNLDCDYCPFREAAQKVREAHNSFIDIVKSIYEGE